MDYVIFKDLLKNLEIKKTLKFIKLNIIAHELSMPSNCLY